jgi:phospholipase/carboxylesterase
MDDRYEPFGLDEGGRDGIVYIPNSARHGSPLMLLFHGFSGNGRDAIETVRPQASQYGVIVAAPDSLGQTWDILEKGHFGPGRFGPDLGFINRVMELVRERYSPARVAVSGISDGASYALCIGPCNGFTTIAFSPGFAFPGETDERPPIFISHGTRDQVLLFQHAIGIADSFGDRGYPLTFHVFDGGHTVPSEVVDVAFAWWLGPLESGANDQWSQLQHKAATEADPRHDDGRV